MMGNTVPLRKKVSILLAAMTFMPVPVTTFAEKVSCIRDYSYQASDVDSKLSCRAIAMEQVKRLLLEELGTYVFSLTEVKDFQVTRDKIITCAGGIVNTIVLEEKWDGRTYYLKAKISADTDELKEAIERFIRNQEQEIQLEAARKRTDEALKEMEDLRKNVEKGGGDKAAQQRYKRAVDVLTAMDWYRKGYAYRFQEYNLKEAMNAFNKAVDLDPGFATAYAGRAAIYCEWEMYEKALKESEQAVVLDPNDSFNLTVRGRSNVALGKVKEGIEDLDRAAVLNPKNVWVYTNRSYAYFLLKKYDEALADADKAIEVDPNEAFVYFVKGRILVGLNKHQDAIPYLDKAIAYNPKVARFYYFRGVALLEINETGRGMEDMKNAASMGYGSARKYLEQKGIR